MTSRCGVPLEGVGVLRRKWSQEVGVKVQVDQNEQQAYPVVEEEW